MPAVNAHDETTPYRRELELLAARHRHWVSLTCDRCRTALTLSSSTAAELEPHLLRTAIATGWILTEVTRQELGDAGAVRLLGAVITSRDLCSTCYAIVFPAPIQGQP